MEGNTPRSREEGLEVITQGVAAKIIGRGVSLPPTYKVELQGLAEVIGVPVGALFLSYDITAHCTSTEAQTEDGRILHAGNLDVPRDPELLKLTELYRKFPITVNFQRQGQTVYSGATEAGYI